MNDPTKKANKIAKKNAKPAKSRGKRTYYGSK